MELAEEITQAVDRLGMKGRKDRTALERGLRCLSKERVEVLTRYEGLTLDQLRIPFQVLPLGTRMALERAGAIAQHAGDDDTTTVEPLPFALELIEAAVIWQSDRDGALDAPRYRQEIARIWAERITVEPSKNVRVPADLGPVRAKIDLVGTVGLDGTITGTDPDGKSTSIQIMVKTAGKAHVLPLKVATTGATSELAPGSPVHVKFAVGLPKRSGLLRKKPQDHNDLKAIVKALPKGQLLCVRYDSALKPAISFVADDKTNAVLAVTDAQSSGR